MIQKIQDGSIDWLANRFADDPEALVRIGFASEEINRLREQLKIDGGECEQCGRLFHSSSLDSDYWCAECAERHHKDCWQCGGDCLALNEHRCSVCHGTGKEVRR